MYRIDGTLVTYDGLAVAMPVDKFAQAWLGLFVNFDRDVVPKAEYLDEFQTNAAEPLEANEKALLLMAFADYTEYFDSFVRADELTRQPDVDPQTVSELEQFMVILLRELQSQDPRFLRIRPLDLRVWWAARDVIKSDTERMPMALAQFQKDLNRRSHQEENEGRTGYLSELNGPEEPIES